MRRVKWFLLPPAVGLTVIALFLFTPIASSFILGQLRARAATYGLQLNYADGSLTPFRGLNFTKLSARYTSPGLSAKIDADRLSVNYGLSFFPFRVRVRKLEIRGAKIEAERKPAVTPEGLKAAPSEWPFAFDLDQAQIDNLQVDYRDPNVKIELHQASADFDTQIAGTSLATRGGFDLGHDGHFVFNENSGAFRGGGKWDLALQNGEFEKLDFNSDLLAENLVCGKFKIRALRADFRSEGRAVGTQIFFEDQKIAKFSGLADQGIHGDLDLTLVAGLDRLFPNPILKLNRGKTLRSHIATDGHSEIDSETKATAIRLPGLTADFELKQKTNFAGALKTDAELRIANADYGRWRIPMRLAAEKKRFELTLEAERQTAGRKSLPATWAGNIKLNASLENGAFGLGLRIPQLKLAQLKPEDLRVNLSGSLRNQSLLIPEFSFAYAEDLLRIKGQASLNLATKDAQLGATAFFHFQDFFGLTGLADLPLTLSVGRGEDFSLAGEMHFENLGWRKGDYRVENINGAIPLRERFKFLGGYLKFAHLLNENPFERVDFNRVRPLLNSKKQLTIQTLAWAERAYGPFNGFASLDQNLIAAHAFDLDLGAGKAYGELFFNFNPRNLQVGFLGRLTDLNLTEFLPKEFLKGQDVNSRDLSARAGLICNINRSTLEGRVDVTEIGGRQLTALMNVLDPNYADDKFNKIRNLLQIGFPTAVNAAFNDGFMDMDVDLKILSVVKRESVHGVPLTGFISRATGELARKAQEGIIQ